MDQVCRQMTAALQQSTFEAGVVSRVQAVTRHLMKHLPAASLTPHELPGKPVEF